MNETVVTEMPLAEAIEKAREYGTAAKGIPSVSRTLIREIENLTAERDQARQFARAVFKLCDWPEGGDLDGCDMQDAAVECGLLTPVQATEPCNVGHEETQGCFCSEWDDFPQTCYRKVDWLLEPEPAPAAVASGGEG